MNKKKLTTFIFDKKAGVVRYFREKLFALL